MTREEAIAELTKSAEIILGDQSFVAVIWRDEEQFVQLCAAKTRHKDGAMGRPVIAIDRPLVDLTDDQDERAREFFANHGVFGPTSVPVQFDDGHGNAGRMGFTKTWFTYAEKPQEAALLAIEVFEAVFQPPAWPEYEVQCFQGILVDGEI